MVLVHDTSSRRGLQVYQVSLKNLERFSSYRADMICDGQTDGQTDARGKTICLPTLSGGDIIIDKPNMAPIMINYIVAHLMINQTDQPIMVPTIINQTDQPIVATIMINHTDKPIVALF